MNNDHKLVKLAKLFSRVVEENHPAKLLQETDKLVDFRFYYAETHYILLLVHLYILDQRDRKYLELATLRLKLWGELHMPITFFNAFALCLTKIIIHREQIEESSLLKVLGELIERITPSRASAYEHSCGNNMYLQQVLIDLVLLPLARDEKVSKENIQELLSEFKKYITAECFFYDLPRIREGKEIICPPTYIMKEIFLLIISQQLVVSEEVEKLLYLQLQAVLPFLTNQGNFSYFGRTDNSPFAAGLTIFNLKSAKELFPEKQGLIDNLSLKAEEYYLSFPKTTANLFACNRFYDPQTKMEELYSADSYAYSVQYSLASSAYALLSLYFYPEKKGEKKSAPTILNKSKDLVVYESKDLGLIKANKEELEIILRTNSQLTAGDRRYLGPSILRLSVGDKLLVGALPLTVETDYEVCRIPSSNKLKKALNYFQNIYKNGYGNFDYTSIGFCPVLRYGNFDFIPYYLDSVNYQGNYLEFSYRVVKLLNRGIFPCIREITRQLKKNLFPSFSFTEIPPGISLVKEITFQRKIIFDSSKIIIEDSLQGEIKGMSLIYSVRHLPNVKVLVDGLQRFKDSVSWGSDGRQKIDYYREFCQEKNVKCITSIFL